MHEMTIAMNVIEAVTRRAKENTAAEVTEIDLEIGKLAGVLTDSLRFCFEAACKNTIASSCRLVIHNIPALGICSGCHNKFPMGTLVSFCPDCQGSSLTLIQGNELKIKSFNYQ